MPVVTSQPIQLSAFIPDITTALLTYNRLRWHRSRTGQNGLYEPATQPAAVAAVLLGTADGPHQINGKTLSFRVNGITQVDVVFADPDPVTTAQAVAAIDAATALVNPTSVSNKIQLATAITGSGASIEILECTAAPFMGFQTGDADVGEDADTTLSAGVHEYFLTDQNSDPDFWYRVEMRHSATGQTSGLGVPFDAGAVQGIAKSLTIVCYLRLSDMTGRPISGRVVTFFNPFTPNRVQDGNEDWGIFRHFATMTTDKNGYAELRLLRGMNVDFAVDGTNFIRRIAIPSSGDSVDLLDPVLVVQDEFGIQQPQIDFAVRTT